MLTLFPRECVSFITVALSHSQGEITQYNTIITALCSDGNVKLCHVAMLSAALQAAWYTYYS